MKRVLALLLAAMMAFTMIACASDPSTNQPQNETTAPSETTAASAETTVPEETELLPDIPDVGDQYKGTEFVILERGREASTYKERWISAEGITGETINDAVFKRNSAVEEKFGITIRSEINTKPQDAMSKEFAAGDDSYDVAYPLMQYIRPYLLQGICYNLLEVPDYLGFDKPWWDANVNEAFTYKDKLYVAVSDISLAPGTLARGMIFNRDLVREYDLEDPYALVKNNQWTLEKAAEMISKVSDDTNGDSIHGDEDVYGMLTELGGTNGNLYNFVIAGGTTMFKKDAEENITIEFMNERTMAIIEKCRSFLLDKSTTRSYTDLGTPPAGYNMYTYGRLLFSTDHFLFYQGGCLGFEELANNNMESEYGIVPNPKFDTQQASFQNHTDPNASVFCIPVNNSPDDLERITIITEYMSYMSSKTLLPDFYETLIKLRRARVPEVGEMVDIIKNNIYYDITTLYGLNHAPVLDNAFDSGDFGSVFASLTPALEAEIEKLGEKLSVLD